MPLAAQILNESGEGYGGEWDADDKMNHALIYQMSHERAFLKITMEAAEDRQKKQTIKKQRRRYGNRGAPRW